ncbi:hypothetical protein [Erythrobacter aureus]|uniref:Uncharacterized protein n=1 Tax=Erythrobacter aureus TaxID=2182384 RepID=A0A345YJ09_9SPHN|nr:hypothetical protein [Erythrobacter aureus]AXK43911.1 hypothetical protein DVR09_15770 [Erythrobacter aureus]
MIFHLSVSGTPVSWSIVAIYDTYLGVASKAALAWHEKTDTHQCVIEISERDERVHNLFLAKLDGQYPDDRHIHLNSFRKDGPVKIEDELRDRIEALLRAALIDRAVFIPRDEWEVRYPGQKLIHDRSSAFHAALAEARAAGEELEFDERWIPYMDVPDDFVAAFKLGSSPQGYFVEPNRDGVEDPTGGRTWKMDDTALIAVRLLNSGWSWDDVQVLMLHEPVAA